MGRRMYAPVSSWRLSRTCALVKSTLWTTSLDVKAAVRYSLL